MAPILDELQVSDEKAALVIPYQQDRCETIDQHIHAVVTYSDPTTQLMFSSQPGSHLPEAGLNPLVDSAAHLFFQMGKLKRIKEHNDLEKLHFELVKEVRHFQDKVHTCRYHSESLDEYIPIATYALCMALDDLIADTTWGGHGKWNDFSLVSAIFAESASQESFFIILERVIIEPDAYMDVVEFMYICLSFGMRCRNEAGSNEFTRDQHEQISNFLYKYIQAYRGNVSKVLAPFPIRAKHLPPAPKRSLADVFDVISEHTQSLFDKLKSFGGKSKPRDYDGHNEILAKNLQRLRNRFDSAANFIKKSRVRKNGTAASLERLPWYLMIGATDSGKTSLLSKSNINFILGKKANSPQKQPASMAHTFDWWITQHAVLVDVPGSYMAAADKNSAMSNEIWQHFLGMVQKSQKRKSLGGVVVAVSVTELIDRQKRDALLANLACRIRDIQKRFGAGVPFYFSITKMDLVPGFLDFFNDCGTEELLQAWGITMPPSAPDYVTSVFIKRFNALIKILNNQMIQRLHFERSQYIKSQIKDFPLYVERIKDEFASLLNSLKAHETRICLKGVYLTSAMQNGFANRDAVHPETMSVSGGSEKMLEILKAPEVRQSPYFIKQFILQGIMQ